MSPTKESKIKTSKTVSLKPYKASIQRSLDPVEALYSKLLADGHLKKGDNVQDVLVSPGWEAWAHKRLKANIIRIVKKETGRKVSQKEAEKALAWYWLDMSPTVDETQTDDWTITIRRPRK